MAKKKIDLSEVEYAENIIQEIAFAPNKKIGDDEYHKLVKAHVVLTNFIERNK